MSNETTVRKQDNNMTATISAHDLAKHFLSSRPGAAELTPQDLSQEVRKYVIESYSRAYGSIAAAKSTGLEVNKSDNDTIQMLTPYISDISPVTTAVEALLSGSNAASTAQNQPAEPDVSTMSSTEYAQYRTKFAFAQGSGNGLFS